MFFNFQFARKTVGPLLHRPPLSSLESVVSSSNLLTTRSPRLVKCHVGYLALRACLTPRAQRPRRPGSEARHVQHSNKDAIVCDTKTCVLTQDAMAPASRGAQDLEEYLAGDPGPADVTYICVRVTVLRHCSNPGDSFRLPTHSSLYNVWTHYVMLLLFAITTINYSLLLALVLLLLLLS